MARSYSFFAQCFLFTFIMYISQLRLARDDIRTAGVHVSTLVASVQVGMLALMLSMQTVLTFVVGIVKRDNLSFTRLAAYFPLVHEKHLEAPTEFEYLPNPQLMHVVAVAMFEYFPTCYDTGLVHPDPPLLPLRTSDLDTGFFHTDMWVLSVHFHDQPTVLYCVPINLDPRSICARPVRRSRWRWS
jgi:hypothetical protein